MNPNNMHIYSDDEENTIVTVVGTRIVTKDELLDATGYDPEYWMVEKYEVKSHEQAQKGPDDMPRIIVMHSVHARIVPRPEADARVKIDDLRRDLRSNTPALDPPPVVSAPRRRMMELSISDLHFGKYAWRQAHGAEYDMDIARHLFSCAIEHALQIGLHFDVEQFCMPLGNDLFNADNGKGQTTRGTPQDQHGLHRQHFKEVRRMVQAGIERLHEFAPVHVPIVPGNHDYDTMYMLGDSLEDRFYSTKTVDIDNGPRPRKYMQYGTNLIGWTHGDKEKLSMLPLTMANEVPHLWAETKHREWHLGHMHRKKEYKYMPVDEKGGVRLRVIPGLTALDDWHMDRAYKGVRASEAYLWDYRHGFNGMFSINVDGDADMIAPI